jgi:hypothetical protein
MSREIQAIVRAVLGLAQGAAIYLLSLAEAAKVWPFTDAMVFGPLLMAVLFIPPWGWPGVGNLRLRTFAIWIAAAVIVPALGFYDLGHDPDGGVFGAVSSTHPRPEPALWLVTLAGLAIAHTLVAAGDADLAFGYGATGVALWHGARRRNPPWAPMVGYGGPALCIN